MMKYFTKETYADMAALKHEMRLLSMKLHPDRKGGSAEEFKAMMSEFAKIESELSDGGTFRNMPGEEKEVRYEDPPMREYAKRDWSRSNASGRQYYNSAFSSEKAEEFEESAPFEYEAPRKGPFAVRAKEIVFSRMFFKFALASLLASSYFSIGFALAALGIALIAKEWKISFLVAFATFASIVFFHTGTFVSITDALAVKSVDIIIFATVMAPFAFFAKSYAFKRI